MVDGRIPIEPHSWWRRRVNPVIRPAGQSRSDRCDDRGLQREARKHARRLDLAKIQSNPEISGATADGWRRVGREIVDVVDEAQTRKMVRQHFTDMSQQRVI